MTESQSAENTVDVFIVGGGVNGCGVARNAAGRGLSVTLAEMNDLASATSSASTKLFHGGLRYLEYFEFKLVRKALIEREILLRSMPHISWPMRFVLPYHKDMRFENDTPTSKLLSTIFPWMKGRRPAWLIRLGLFLYDFMGGREILPSTSTLNLRKDPEGLPLKNKFERAYEYSDCWIEDSRLVVLCARDAEARGASILTQTKVTAINRLEEAWEITTQGPDGSKTHFAKALVNAAGPWVEDIARGLVRQNTTEGVRLVKGSHIVTKALFEHDKCYFFQGEDGRIIFAIPYEQDFTLIGTTDVEHGEADVKPECSNEEADYLCAFASNYFDKPVSRDDIVWRYSGVRPLYDDGATSATAATREYVLTLDENGPPILNVFGGKITTHRKLAEAVMDKLSPFFTHAKPEWTKAARLPGGDFDVVDFDKLVAKLSEQFTMLEPKLAKRLARAYGTDAFLLLADVETASDLGQDFGNGIYAKELDWGIAKEWVRTAEDFLWRRTKMGLRVTDDQAQKINAYIQAHL